MIKTNGENTFLRYPLSQVYLYCNAKAKYFDEPFAGPRLFQGLQLLTSHELGKLGVMSGNYSSSEDEYRRIKEAVDRTFLTEDLYANDNLKKKPESPPKSVPCIRNQKQQEVSVNPFSVKVTPEFQRHVSKHLSKVLDELIDDTQIVQKCKKSKAKRNLNSGVKLLSSSADYLLSNGHTEVSVKIRNLIKKDLDEIDYEERAKEVAVSPEWVLSQEETRYWSPNTKGKIEVINLDNCRRIIKN